MEIRKGIPVSPGVSIKEAFVLDSEEFRIPRRFIKPEEVPRQLERFENAMKDAVTEVVQQQKKVAVKIGEDYASIFEVHLRILQDKKVIEEIKNLVTEKQFAPEYAVSVTLRRYIKAFQNVDDAYLADRVYDIYDIEKRILRNLLGASKEELNSLKEEVVLIARDLTVSQTAGLDKTKVVGFATDMGGRTSHTAILARALEIPAVVGLETITSDVSGGDTLIIDGNRGIVIIQPDEETLQKYKSQQFDAREFEDSLFEIGGLPAETRDGVRISLFGNIEFPLEIKSAVKYGVDGIGLFRTEFLFLDLDREPKEEEHFNSYMEALNFLEGLPIVIRTLDLGADKFGVAKAAKEKNPFLGCRSIRYSLIRLDMFKTQIRAILRASAYGNVSIMFPLVSTLEEVKKARAIMREVMDELDKEQIPYNKNIKAGIMIEVPSAALSIDLLAKECDFFSIGTNDLIQYTLAVDRVNATVASLYNPLHPAVLKLIKHVIDESRKYNIPVALCGEMGGDPLYTLLLLGMGLTQLSVTPIMVPQIKKLIRTVTLVEARSIARTALSFEDTRNTTAYLREVTKKILPEVL